MAARLALLAAVAAGMLLRAPAAHACTCDVPSVRAAFAEGDVVFTGTVTTVERDPANDATLATITVEDLYKGSVGESAVVRTAINDEPSDCGVDYVPGVRHVVFATISDGELTASVCDGNSLGPDAPRDAGYEPIARATPLAGTGDASASPGAPGSTPGWVVAAAAVLLAAAAGGLLVRFRGRRAGARG